MRLFIHIVSLHGEVPDGVDLLNPRYIGRILDSELCGESLQ